MPGTEHAETLKALLQNVINDRTEEAEAQLHDYFVAKTREVASLNDPDPELDDTEADEADEADD